MSNAKSFLDRPQQHHDMRCSVVQNIPMISTVTNMTLLYIPIEFEAQTLDIFPPFTVHLHSAPVRASILRSEIISQRLRFLAFSPDA